MRRLVLATCLLIGTVSFAGETTLGRTYPVTIVRIVDADTFELSVDLGFGLYAIRQFRIAEYDAPETFRPKNKKEKEHGTAATNYAKAWLEGKTLYITGVDKVGKYGRWLCSIHVQPDDVDYAKHMIGKGFVKPP